MQTDIHFWSYLARFFLEWEMFQTKVVEKIKTHILGSVIFFSENRAIYEIMWENVVERGRPQMAIWCMRFACWVTKVTDTHLGCVVLISTATVVTRRHVIVTLYVHLVTLYVHLAMLYVHLALLFSVSRKMLYIKAPDLSSSSSDGLLLPFARSTWWAMIAAILLFIVCLAAVWHLGSRQERQQNDDVYGLYNSAFCMIGVCCRQSKPQRLPLTAHFTCYTIRVSHQPVKKPNVTTWWVAPTET